MLKSFKIFDVKSTKSQHNHSFSRSFRSVHKISSVLGISYFQRVHSISQKLASSAYALAIFILFVASFLYRILNISPLVCNANPVAYSVIGIQQILSAIAIFTIYYQVLFYKSKFEHIFKLVTLIEHEFVMLNIQIPYKRFAMNIFVQIIVVIVFFPISFAFFVIYYNVRDIGLIALELFVSMNPMLAITLNLITFTNAVWFIRNALQYLKEILMDLCAVDSLLTDAHSNDVRTVKLMIQMPYGLFSKYKQIARIYELLYEMANHLNDIFGLSNLASMGMCSFGKLQLNLLIILACVMAILFCSPV